MYLINFLRAACDHQWQNWGKVKKCIKCGAVESW